MADHTHIEWTDATWNVVTGCSVVSPGCTNCYAMRLAGTRLRHHPSRAGLTVEAKAGQASSSAKRDRPAKHVWNGQVRFNEAWLTQPLRWRRPRRIFVAAHGDLFHEGVTDDQLDRIFAVMALCPQHTFQVLTKRPERMRAYLTDQGGDGAYGDFRIGEHFRRLGADFNRDHFGYRLPLPNVWLGVSVEDQNRANQRVPELMATPAAVRWISAEPLLGPIDLDAAWHGESALDADCWGECAWCRKGHTPLHNCDLGRQTTVEAQKGRSGLDWVVAGGESGPGARPMHPDWARQLRDQCAAAGVPFLFKQWGEFAPAILEGNVIEASHNIAWPDGSLGGGKAADHGGLGTGMLPLGKKRAGRRLDGQLHEAYPEPQS